MKTIADKALVARLDGTLEVISIKNHVVLKEDRAIKDFVSGRRSASRFAREIDALRRLHGIDGIPALLEVSAAQRQLQIARIAGVPLTQCEQVPDSLFASLRALIDAMLERGVARHSLPPRDVILRPDGTAGLVDFERSRGRRFRFGLIWLGSRRVTRFQLLRLIDEHAPHLLTAAERRSLRFQRKLRSVYRSYLDLRRLRPWR